MHAIWVGLSTTPPYAGPLTRSSQVSIPLACLFVLTRKKNTKVHFKNKPNSLGAEGIDVNHDAKELPPSSVPPGLRVPCCNVWL